MKSIQNFLFLNQAKDIPVHYKYTPLYLLTQLPPVLKFKIWHKNSNSFSQFSGEKFFVNFLNVLKKIHLKIFFLHFHHKTCKTLKYMMKKISCFCTSSDSFILFKVLISILIPPPVYMFLFTFQYIRFRRQIRIQFINDKVGFLRHFIKRTSARKRNV